MQKRAATIPVRTSAVQSARKNSIVGKLNDLLQSAFAQSSPKPLDASPQRVQLGQKLEVRYTRQLNWIALAILFAAYQMGGAFQFDQHPNVHMVGMTSYDAWLMQAAPFVMTLIGLAWLWHGLAGSQALSIDNRGVSGFTLLGTKSIAWADIDRIEIEENNKNYGRQLLIHAARSSPSGSYLWLNHIPLPVKNLDHSETEIVAAIQSYRPDLKLQPKSWMPF